MRPPITQLTTDSVIESLKSEESAGTDQKLWNVCRHAVFRWPYAPNHSPKMDAHFVPHCAHSLVLFEHPNPFPNHAITHRIVTIHLTDMVMSLTW